MTQERHFDVVIVGGGIAGLTAAWELRDRKILLLEASDRVGGRMKSEPRGEYWLNMGAHVLPGPGTIIDRLIQEMGLQTTKIPGSIMGLSFGDKILTSGAAESYPLSLPMSIGGRISFANAGLKLRRAARGFSQYIASNHDDSITERRTRNLAFRGDETFADLLGPLHPEADKIFKAITSRVATIPENLAAGYGAALFSMVWSKDSALARNLLGGTAQLPQTIAFWLGDRVCRNAPVNLVSKENDLVRIVYSYHGEEIEITAKSVIMATQAHVTRALIYNLPTELDHALSQIVYGPYLCGSILTTERSSMPWDDVYAIAVAGRSFSMFYNHANPLRLSGSQRSPGGSLMVFAGGGHASRLMDKTDQEITALFCSDLQKIYPEIEGQIGEVIITRWEQGLPYAKPGRYRHQASLEHSLGNIFLAGDYLDWAHMDGAATSGYEAAKQARQVLASIVHGQPIEVSQPI